MFVFFAAVAVFFLVRALTIESGAWIGFSITGLIGLLTLPLLIAAMRDLRADPMETEAPLRRKWRKADLFIVKGHYVMVGKRVFRVRKDIWLEMPEPPARVLLLHFPHTNTLIDWQTVASTDDEEAEPVPAARDWRTVASPPTADAPADPGVPTGPAVRPPVFGESSPPPRAGERERPAQRVEPPRFGGSAGRRPGDPPDRSADRQPGDPPGRADA
ncbi:MAG: hypothetical protein OXG38_12625 [Chloroflexi bacterium]|nr:hypothetical protein [Chloroflexota bacterium]